LKLVRFRNDRRESYGVMSDDQIVCLCSFAKSSKLGLPPSLEEFVGLGATGTDMTFEIAKTIGASVTYGWLIASASSETDLRGGTSQVLIAGSVVTIGGDIIVAINETES